MIITKTRTHKFNMAQYESLEISATVEVDTEELEPGADPIATANGLLDDVLQEDIDRADQTSTTPEDSTYVHSWKDSL
jgi:hypothetical protein